MSRMRARTCERHGRTSLAPLRRHPAGPAAGPARAGVHLVDLREQPLRLLTSGALEDTVPVLSPLPLLLLRAPAIVHPGAPCPNIPTLTSRCVFPLVFPVFVGFLPLRLGR